MDVEILIVGAGPTGLVLALTLDKLKIPFKIIENKAKPDEVSKAMLVVPGTLEHYSQLDIVDDVLEAGLEIFEGVIHNNKRSEKLKFEDFRAEVSRFSKLFTYPQDENERLLVQTLKERGHSIYWGTTFEELKQEESKVIVEMSNNQESYEETFAYVVGANGGSSSVRNALNIEFQGKTNTQLFFVSDVELENEEIQEKKVHAFMKNQGFLLCFPLRNKTTKRLIGIIPKELTKKENLSMADLSPALFDQFGLKIAETSWFSRYKIHHRLAETFKVGRVFLAGDAAHIHSPVGGQGMNAGIADAINLGWKLADTLNKKVNPAILDTYEEERRTYAKQLVKTTDRAFKIVTTDNLFIHKIRNNLSAMLGKFALTKSDTLSSRLFQVISQTGIHYKTSQLNAEANQNELLGLRLPYYKNNLDSIDEMRWHVHVYGEIKSDFKEFLDAYALPYDEISWEDEMNTVDLAENTAYLIRPDGYIAWASKNQDDKSLANYFKKWQIVPH